MNEQRKRRKPRVTLGGKILRIGDVVLDPTKETLWTISDIYRKTKRDQLRLYDEDWNEAPAGTIFIYATNVNGVAHVSYRDRVENWNHCILVKKLKKIKCPICGHIENKLVELKKELKNE